MKKLILFFAILLFARLNAQTPPQDSTQLSSPAAETHTMPVAINTAPEGAPIASAKTGPKEIKLEKKISKDYDDYNYRNVIADMGSNKNPEADDYRKLGESYKMKADYIKAESAFAMAVERSKSQGDDSYIQNVYAYAQVLKMNGKYAEAQEQLDLYSTLKNNDTRTRLYNENKNYTTDLLTDKGQFTLRNLNSNSNQQDFGATFYKKQVVYTSSKQEVSYAYRRWNGNELPFLDLYIGDEGTDNEIINSKKLSAVNQKYHEGPSSYNKAGTVMLFTQDNYKSKSSDGVQKLDLYETHFVNGKWVGKIPFPLNNKEYSVGHPALSADGNTLYFASDMPGGKGGVDLYKIQRDSAGLWGKAENLGENINTEGNEMFPFIHESGLFAFASDGRPGLGGLDIFITEIKNGEIKKAINPGAPMNSSKDDFSFVMDSAQTKGYMASNREGGKGDDDIYSFHVLKPIAFLQKKQVKGIALDKEGVLQANTQVYLFDKDLHVLDTVTTTETGAYAFEVENNGEYSLTGKKENYTDGKAAATLTDAAPVAMTDLVMEKAPPLSLTALVLDGKTSQSMEGVKLEFIDKVKGTAEAYTTPASGEYRNPLTGYKVGDRLNYDILISKEGYISKVVTFTHDITKPGEIKLHESVDINLSKPEVGMNLAKMIDIKPIYFDVNKFNIRPDAQVELEKIVKVMTDFPLMVIELGSHTDCRATAKYNAALSDKRAKASAQYIKSKIKNPERISGKGYGESKLINGCACEGAVKSTCTEEEHQANRRTEFLIQKLD